MTSYGQTVGNSNLVLTDPRLIRLDELHSDPKVPTSDVWRYFQESIQDAGISDIPDRLSPPYFGRGDLNFKQYDSYGSHTLHDRSTYFKFYAPQAKQVFLKIVDGDTLEMHRDGDDWLYAGKFNEGTVYNYEVETADGEKIGYTDPFAKEHRGLPGFMASVIKKDHNFDWTDEEWLENRNAAQNHPRNLYEVHPMSWKTKDDGGYLNYRELAPLLIAQAKEMNYSHVQLMGILEHSCEGSMGYQPVGFFSPTHRMGSVEDFQFMVNELHRANVGVILDWVPGHFSEDSYTLGSEYSNGDMRWGSHVFNHDDPRVRDFLLSSADYWCRRMHMDGLRVDNTASLIYKESGEANPNGHQFLRDLNTVLHREHRGVITIAEDSSGHPHTTTGWILNPDRWSLKLDFRLNMWLTRNVLDFFHAENRSGFQYEQLVRDIGTISSDSEKWTLGFSHDEVTHGVGSIYSRMPGSHEEKLTSLRLLYAYQTFIPVEGALNFMGNDFAHKREWPAQIKSWNGNQLDWSDREAHGHFVSYMKSLNGFAKNADFADTNNFQWLKNDDSTNSVIAFRRGEHIVVFNFGLTDHEHYQMDLHDSGLNLQEVFSSEIAKDFHHTCSDRTLTIKLPAQSYVVYKTV